MIPDFTSYVWPETMSEGMRWFMMGFTVGGMIRLFRASLRWFKRAGVERYD